MTQAAADLSTARLDELERTIRDGLQTFVDVGRALAAIRDEQQYRRAGFKTFEAYCKERWEFSRMRAHQLIAAAAVTENVNNCLQSRTPVPSTESQARPLSKLPPDQQPEAWAEAVETAPEGKVTAKHVAEVVSKRLPPKPPAKPKPQPSAPPTERPRETVVDVTHDGGGDEAEPDDEPYCEDCGATVCVCDPDDAPDDEDEWAPEAASMKLEQIITEYLLDWPANESLWPAVDALKNQIHYWTQAAQKRGTDD